MDEICCTPIFIIDSRSAPPSRPPDDAGGTQASETRPSAPSIRPTLRTSGATDVRAWHWPRQLLLALLLACARSRAALLPLSIYCLRSCFTSARFHIRPPLTTHTTHAAGTSGVPGSFSNIAITLIQQNFTEFASSSSLLASARVLGLMHVAMFDAATSGWAAKFKCVRRLLKRPLAGQLPAYLPLLLPCIHTPASSSVLLLMMTCRCRPSRLFPLHASPGSSTGGRRLLSASATTHPPGLTVPAPGTGGPPSWPTRPTRNIRQVRSSAVACPPVSSSCLPACLPACCRQLQPIGLVNCFSDFSLPCRCPPPPSPPGCAAHAVATAAAITVLASFFGINTSITVVRPSDRCGGCWLLMIQAFFTPRCPCCFCELWCRSAKANAPAQAADIFPAAPQPVFAGSPVTTQVTEDSRSPRGGSNGFDISSTNLASLIIPPRTVTLAQVIAEAGASRIFGGIHFNHSIRDGNTIGANVANFVLANYPGNFTQQARRLPAISPS